LADLRRVKAGMAPELDLDAVKRKYFSPTAIFATATLMVLFLAAAAFFFHHQTPAVAAKQITAPPEPAVQKIQTPAPAPAPAPPAQLQPVAAAHPSAPPKKQVFTGNPTPWIPTKPAAQPERERAGPPERFGQGQPPELEDGPP